MPFWATFLPRPRSPDAPNGPVSYVSSLQLAGNSAAAGLHYLSFMDVVKLNVSRGRIYPDQHYEGPTARHPCPTCRPEVCHRADAALARHMKMMFDRCCGLRWEICKLLVKFLALVVDRASRERKFWKRETQIFLFSEFTCTPCILTVFSWCFKCGGGFGVVLGSAVDLDA